MKRMIKYIVLIVFILIFLSANTHRDSSFPKITVPYTPEKAFQNGDVVLSLSGYMNMDRWHQFIANVNGSNKDKVRVTSYSTEGYPIFHELTYDGETIKYIHDNSQDRFGLYNGRPEFSCESIDVIETEGHQYYALVNCDKDVGARFVFPYING